MVEVHLKFWRKENLSPSLITCEMDMTNHNTDIWGVGKEILEKGEKSSVILKLAIHTCADGDYIFHPVSNSDIM